MTSSIPPSSAAASLASVATGSGDSGAGTGTSFATAATTAGAPVPPSGAVSPGAQIAPVVAAAQAALANTVNLSPQAQQAVKLEAFAQLVTQLVNQVQPTKVDMPASWPAGGVLPQLQQLVSALLQQATAGQPLPQQLVSLQSWSAQLTQAVLQRAGTAQLSPPAATSGVQAPAPSQTAALPALQNWLVQQGSIQAEDGERAFTLTLRVPVAWAQAQAALAAALPKPMPGHASANMPAAAVGHPGLPVSSGAAPMATSTGSFGTLQLPFAGSVQQLASGSMGLVMQPLVQPGTAAAMTAQTMRTSAILQLEFQPLAQAVQSAQAASVYLPAHLVPQDVQAMLQGRGTDPWLLMAQAQADGQGRKQQSNANEQSNFCNRAGCQYQGRAICAQPFCAEMNYLWSVDRAQRASRL
ncbi:hypothetical protein [Comamonas sp.]